MTIFDACFMSWSRNQDDWLGKVKGWVGYGGAGAGEEQQQQQQQGKQGGKKKQQQLEVTPLKLEGPAAGRH
jgi:hypothetical protein